MKKLGLGCMRFPILNGKYNEINKEEVKEMVDLFLDNGFTYFDTAYPYHEGNSERILKEVLTSRYPRDKYILTTKLPMFSMTKEEEIDKIFNEQLDKLGVDYLDYYLVHALNEERFNLAKQLSVFDHLIKYKNEGKIKHIGISFHDSSKVLDKILSEKKDVIEVVQLQINYLDWESQAIESRLCYEVCQKYHKKVIVMEPLKGGSLVKLSEEAKEIFTNLNKDAPIASYGIRFAASLDDVIMVLSGMSNLDQLKENMSYMKEFKKLDDKEIAAINKVTEITKSKILIPCTDCKYCVKGCPKKIPIPKYFSMCNEDYSLNSNLKFYYNTITKSENVKASECIKCGLCERNCPQHLKIRDLLENEVVRRYEKEDY